MATTGKRTKKTGHPGRIVSLLKEAQEEHGYITPDSITRLASSMGIPVHEVYAVASFYSFLSLRPQGRHVIRICRSLPCGMNHSNDIENALKAEIGIVPGETTPDGRFSLEHVNCIGLCDKSPAMLVDSDPHTLLTPEKIRGILKTYK